MTLLAKAQLTEGKDDGRRRRQHSDLLDCVGASAGDVRRFVSRRATRQAFPKVARPEGPAEGPDHRQEPVLVVEASRGPEPALGHSPDPDPADEEGETTAEALKAQALRRRQKAQKRRNSAR